MARPAAAAIPTNGSAAPRKRGPKLIICMTGADFSEEAKDRCAIAIGELLAAHFLKEAANDNSPTGDERV
jgi:hypothetical protein